MICKELPADTRPLRSAHTISFPGLLEHLGISLLVTTYQAGKLAILRADNGVLNTHFRGFNKPMGLALAGDRLAIGAGIEIWEYHNVPALAHRLEPKGKHDACFLPRSGHVTGNVLIHEMAWHDGELWFVNTRFSCLCTLDPLHSFVPRWRPAFISGVAPDDRCHLNGLGFSPDGRCLVTALGETDSPDGCAPPRATVASSWMRGATLCWSTAWRCHIRPEHTTDGSGCSNRVPGLLDISMNAPGAMSPSRRFRASPAA